MTAIPLSNILTEDLFGRTTASALGNSAEQVVADADLVLDVFRQSQGSAPSTRAFLSDTDRALRVAGRCFAIDPALTMRQLAAFEFAPEERKRLALLSLANNVRAVIDHFPLFQLMQEEMRVDVAAECIERDPSYAMDHYASFSVLGPEGLQRLAQGYVQKVPIAEVVEKLVDPQSPLFSHRANLLEKLINTHPSAISPILGRFQLTAEQRWTILLSPVIEGVPIAVQTDLFASDLAEFIKRCYINGTIPERSPRFNGILNYCKFIYSADDSKSLANLQKSDGRSFRGYLAGCELWYLGLSYLQRTGERLVSPEFDQLCSDLLFSPQLQPDIEMNQLLYVPEGLFVDEHVKGRIKELFDENKLSHLVYSLLALAAGFSCRLENEAWQRIKNCLVGLFNRLQKEIKDFESGVGKILATALCVLVNNKTLSPAEKIDALIGRAALNQFEFVQRLRSFWILYHYSDRRELLPEQMKEWDKEQLHWQVRRLMETRLFPEGGLQAHDAALERLCASQRRPGALEYFVCKLVSRQNVSACGREDLQRFLLSAMQGTSREERYNVERSEYLQALSNQHPRLWEMWRTLPAMQPLERGLDVGISDDWQDLMLSGKEVQRSCLNLECGVNTMQALVSKCLDGKIQMICVKRAQDGRVMARAFMKLLFAKGQQADTPAVLIEPVYTALGFEKYQEVVVRVAQERARALGLTLYQIDDKAQGHELYSLSTRGFGEYEDALLKIIPDGWYRLNNVSPVPYEQRVGERADPQ